MTHDEDPIADAQGDGDRPSRQVDPFAVDRAPGPVPVEPPLHAMHRLDLASQLASWKCPHCDSQQVPIGVSAEGWVRAVDVHHEPGCPDYVAD